MYREWPPGGTQVTWTAPITQQAGLQMLEHAEQCSLLNAGVRTSLEATVSNDIWLIATGACHKAIMALRTHQENTTASALALQRKVATAMLCPVMRTGAVKP